MIKYYDFVVKSHICSFSHIILPIFKEPKRSVRIFHFFLRQFEIILFSMIMEYLICSPHLYLFCVFQLQMRLFVVEASYLFVSIFFLLIENVEEVYSLVKGFQCMLRITEEACVGSDHYFSKCLSHLRLRCFSSFNFK